MKSLLCSLLISLLSYQALAADGRADYDLDDDRLIEINDLADLNEIRDHRTGTALYGSSAGCPVEGCNGFELTTDLDFDTNADGKLDASDTYWNGGLGWVAIGSGSGTAFAAVLDGNGHVIKNLMINRPTSDYQGLLGYASSATVRNLGLTGSLMSIVARSYIGGLAGRFSNGAITATYSTGVLASSYTSSTYIGGLVGYCSTCTIKASFTAGSVTAVGSYAGGIVGEVSSATLNSVFSTASVTSGFYAGGLVGSASGTTTSNSFAAGRVVSTGGWGALHGSSGTVTNSYWAIDTTGQTASGASTITTSLGVTLAQLQCPTSADDTSCVVTKTLYQGWGALLDLQSNPYWDFGTSSQLPALVLNGVSYRDGDGDGVLDADDAWPALYAAGLDSDGDGSTDRWTLGCETACQNASGLTLDQFPTSAAASVDLDLDGLPDAWNAGCDAGCQTASGLVIDALLNDSDNDGSSNAVDTDDNGDGIADVDSDGDGLIEITTLAELNAMRYNLKGTAQQLVINGAANSSGCPIEVFNGVLTRSCIGYELVNDLDFDTNADGKLDASDTYWNGGLGWVAIASSTAFAAILEGNGHVIKNLMINRPTSDYQGLLGYASGATVRNLGLTGSLMSITARSYIGGLAGRFQNGSITATYSTGALASSYTFRTYIGGLVGYCSTCSIKASFTAGSVTAADDDVGGIVGQSSTTTLDSVFSTASVSGGDDVGGLVGSASGTTTSNSFAAGRVVATAGGGSLGALHGTSGTVTNSYWAIGQTVSGASTTTASLGVTLAQLQCPTSANDTSCVATKTLYQGWGALLDSQNNPYWDFGTASQLPALVLNGVSYRDTDTDGVLDADDAWPTLYAAALDADADGTPDRWVLGCDTACQSASGLVLDQFPTNAAVSVDLDLDGLPDAWNASCNTTCQEASGLVLDTHLNDVDNDGITDDIDTDTLGVVNADVDSDGLIDIESLAELDAMRFNLGGTAQQLSANGPADSSGCPRRILNGILVRICSGYELLNDLDFDTNADGKLDAGDTYWNGGLGWVAIDSGAGFAAVLDGNGYVIKNLMINRPTSDFQGLFGRANNASVRNLGLTGSLMSITGQRYVGGLAGRFENGSIIATYATGALASSYTSSTAIGGLVGVCSFCTIKASFTTGSVTAVNARVGGVVGHAGDITLDSVFSTASVTGSYNVGGLVGDGNNTSTSNSFAAGRVFATFDNSQGALHGTSGSVTNSYWAVDTTGQAGSGAFTSATLGVTLAQLQCPTAADDISCLVTKTLYQGWGALVDSQNNPYWDFGTSSQLPALVLNGVSYRDGDSDGVLDADDAWPTLYAAALDADSDGAPDRWTQWCDTACQSASGLTLDQFPTNAAASVDLDLDGLVDAWNSGCNTSCQSVSGLVLDTMLNDSDNDGLINSLDADDNGDGIEDVDVDSDGLIDITSWAELDAVRFNAQGTSQIMTEDGSEGSSGCIAVIKGVLTKGCNGYELLVDLDFDTNGDGVLNELDTYWNEGEGWQPINLSSSTFEGNGHRISNVMINSSDKYIRNIGFFSVVRDGAIRNLGLDGNLSVTKSVISYHGVDSAAALVGLLTSSSVASCYVKGMVTGMDTVGGLVGIADRSSIQSSFSTAKVAGENNIGGLIGYSSNAAITASFVGGSISGVENVGGLAGNVEHTTITSSFSTASVESSDWGVGGLIGYGEYATLDSVFAAGHVSNTDAASEKGGVAGYLYMSDVFNSFWTQDTTGAVFGVDEFDLDGDEIEKSNETSAVTLAQLKCPTSANNSVCVSGKTLFGSWQTHKNAQNTQYWHFGTSTQLPGLLLNGVIYRDGDGDGVLDSDDAFPTSFAASLDTDGDGSPDAWTLGCDTSCQVNSNLHLDSFFDDPAVSLDGDFDGLPDQWNPSCDSGCQAESGFELDESLNDNDNDGIVDTLDDDDNSDGIVDADADSDGFIDIATLAELDAIRYNLSGVAQQLSEGGESDNSGCPMKLINGELLRLCQGYELVNDLDFDTNTDGVLDAEDEFWNESIGWVPIGNGSSEVPFTSIFEGNGYVINNLMINNYVDYQGLFGYIDGATIRNLGLSGSLMSITADDTVGALVGSMNNSSIITSYANTNVIGDGYIGGLVGYGYNSVIEASFTTGQVMGSYGVGGVIGTADSTALSALFSSVSIQDSSDDSAGGIVGYLEESTIAGSYFVGEVPSGTSSGAIAGYSYASTISNSHWSNDQDANLEAVGYFESDEDTSLVTGVTSASLAELMCPVAVDNSSCASASLYIGWGNYRDAQNQSYWRFGRADQLPGLVIKGKVFRDSNTDGVIDIDDTDSDSDGVIDDQDGFPFSAAAAIDADADGAPDSWNTACNNACQLASGLVVDDFPNNAAVSLDIDNDGRPDAWNNGCNSACQNNSGLTLDAYLNDRDNDGVIDSIDPNNNIDNGKPVILVVPEDVNIAATGASTLVTLAIGDVLADDAVDTELTLGVSFAGSQLELDENNQVELPSGALVLKWVVIDDAGNRSEPVDQLVNVYPQIRFTQSEVTTGELSLARLGVSLSGASPVYPITVNFAWLDSESTAMAADVNTDEETGVDLSNLSITINSADDLADAALVIPVISDNETENDETLLFELTSAAAGEDSPFALPVDDDHQQTTVTITELNLPPTVELVLTQAGEAVSVVNRDAGDVTVAATVTDRNGLDQHSFAWSTGDLSAVFSGVITSSSSFTFDPAILDVGDYEVSLVVTDNGNPPLASPEETLSFDVLAQTSSSNSSSSTSSSSSTVSSTAASSVASSAGNNSSSGATSSTASSASGKKGGGGGGSTNAILLLLMLSLLGLRFGVRQRH